MSKRGRKKNKLKKEKLNKVIKQTGLTTASISVLELSLITILTTILSISLVSAIGVTYPQPQNIELTPGQSSYFTFQIQADDFPLTCVPIVEETDGLELAFTQKYEIGANERYNIKPQVIVPKQSAFGNYEAKFCIECSPAAEVEGSRIIPKVCNLPITVNAVSERTRKNLLEEEAPKYFFLWITLLIIAIIILAIIIMYLLKRRKIQVRDKI